MEGVRGRDQEAGMTKRFTGSVALTQRVKPNYRVPFFDELASRCEDGFYLAAGQPLRIESIPDEVGLGTGSYTKLKNIYFKDPSHRAFLCYQRGLMDWLRETDPSVLIVEANFRYYSSNNAIKWMKKSGRPVIGWGLGAKPASGLIGAARDAFIRQFDALIAYSTVGAEQYAAAGFERSRIFVAKNAVISSPNELTPHDPVSGRPIKLLFVGRLQRRKNVDRLIRAVATFGEKERPLLTIVGDGPEMDDLRNLAREFLPETVFTGHLDGRKLEAEFTKADLFVLPGTGGLAVQQAISYALPVIVERGDGTQIDMVSRENGWLLENGSEEELIETLRRAFASADRLVEMGRRSYQIARDEVNIQTMADVFVEAIEKVVRREKVTTGRG